MSRVIKFRAWDADRQRMCTSGWAAYRHNEEDGSVYAFNYNRAGMEQNLEIMQFTGLHDRNGVEIYEGDYLQAAEWKCAGPAPSGLMEWDAEKGRWSLFSPLSSFEVIGNKWANPELLEGEKV